MNFKQCIIFREVAQTKNFTKAADNLYMTQSAVSHAMKALEVQAGTKLFERLNKSVRLTQTGHIFLKEITPILERMESLEERMTKLEQTAPLRIASCITFAQTGLVPLVKKFKAHMPQINVQVKIYRASYSLLLAKEGRADIAFIEGRFLDSGFQTKLISDYALCAVASREYMETHGIKKEKTKSGQGVLNFEKLMALDLLLRERGSAVREVFEAAAALKGFKINPAWESADAEALCLAAEASMGVAVLPKVLVQTKIDKGFVEELSVDGMSLHNDITAVSEKGVYKTEAAVKFWELLERGGF